MRQLPARRLLSSLVLLLLGLLVPAIEGCSGAAPPSSARPSAAPQKTAPQQAAADQFPSRGELTQITAAPLPTTIFDDKVADAERWSLRGPLPEAMEDAPHQAEPPWEKLLEKAAAAKRKSVFLSEAMHCVAREEAAFYLEKKAMPSEGLQGFIAARCGAPTGFLNVASLSIEVPDDMPEEKLFTQSKADVETMIRRGLEGGSRSVGLAFLRENGRAVILFAAQRRGVRVKRIPFVPAEGGQVLLTGELVERAASLRGLVNRGRFGVAECVVDTSVALPRFAIRCEVNPSDESAWIEVAAFPPGRILGPTVLNALIFPGGDPGTTYVQARVEGAPPPESSEAMTTALVDALNRRRAEAGLSAVQIAPAQSEVVGQLAPYYFIALSGRTNELVADKVVLGVRAGWDVDGAVRYGEFTSVVVNGATDPAALIEAAVARPYGRHALLDAEVERIALGFASSRESRYLGVVFGTYALADRSQSVKGAALALERLTALRAARNLPPPSVVPELSGLASWAADQVTRGEATPEAALSDLLHRAVETLGRSVRGVYFAAQSIDQITLSDAMLQQPSLRLALGVGYRRIEGDPWVRTVLLIVVDPGPPP